MKVHAVILICSCLASEMSLTASDILLLEGKPGVSFREKQAEREWKTSQVLNFILKKVNNLTLPGQSRCRRLRCYIMTSGQLVYFDILLLIVVS